ncbi:ADP-ribosylation factor-like protein 3 isoform X2 [Strongylocentrotus purpuratus]|uniref:ADP-ribosylation factor-like protein 3 n=1 Tax=Strongylocentrotus purpuratus TaxID=7668 RepID=A0A7M7NU86_STRPU|nr:ADP-ribosylation factor-like protein 3 isoform X2 [Strongylocentrotus purpuratus]XP_780302.1 ADP-ribosylation factor-like protein 3 isoform X2 [Strongylocentrotus purpuratus]|eukprot:XP_780302.1 PREDICTED: ADP-ribosylation factor-like protein 3 isoform X2 [Strongylocentrotus purpuratus]
MALSWFQELSFLSKAAVVVGTSASLIGGTYILYKRLAVSGTAGPGESTRADTANPEKRVLVLGLDGAGKSSLLKCLSHQEGDGKLEPTEGFNVMCIQAKNTTLNVWEVGGTKNVRSYWDNFLQGTELLVFVVDSADEVRFPEAKEELHKLLKDGRLEKVPLLVVANKQDLPGAKKGGAFLASLDLVLPLKGRDVHLLEVSSSAEKKSANMSEVLDLMSVLSKN